jgi:GT2 family glycosyltransferase
MKTIESLIKCTKTHFTIIMVDDQSTDTTFDYSQELEKRLGQQFFYIKNTENLGVNASWNVGLRTAMAMQAPYICIANNDLVFTDGWDLPLIECLDNGYSLISPYSTEQAIPADFPNGGGRHVNPVGGMPILGACFMFKPELIETIGYFPEQMRHYFGDNWIADQCKIRGLQIGHKYESYIHHMFCISSSKLDNNYHFKHDGDAYQEYCKNFVL